MACRIRESGIGIELRGEFRLAHGRFLLVQGGLASGPVRAGRRGDEGAGLVLRDVLEAKLEAEDAEAVLTPARDGFDRHRQITSQIRSAAAARSTKWVGLTTVPASDVRAGAGPAVWARSGKFAQTKNGVRCMAASPFSSYTLLG